MDIQNPSISAQEKLAAALGSIVFFVPIIMDVKTPYVVRYMKQGFALNIVQLLCSVVGMFFWFLYPLPSFVSFVFFCISVFLAFQAYSGRDHMISWLLLNAEKVIQALNISSWFMPTK